MRKAHTHFFCSIIKRQADADKEKGMEEGCIIFLASRFTLTVPVAFGKAATKLFREICNTFILKLYLDQTVANNK